MEASQAAAGRRAACRAIALVARPLDGRRAFDVCASSGTACWPASATAPASDAATWRKLEERADELLEQRARRLVAPRATGEVVREAFARGSARQTVRARGAPVSWARERCAALCWAREAEGKAEEGAGSHEGND